MTDYAAIYLSDPSLLGSKFLNRFTDIGAFEGLQDGDRASGLDIHIGIKAS